MTNIQHLYRNNCFGISIVLFADLDHGQNVDVYLDSPRPHIGHDHFKDGVHSAVTQCDQQNIIILKKFNIHRS